MKEEGSKTFKISMYVLGYIYLNSLQSSKIPTEKDLVRLTPIVNTIKINIVTSEINLFH